MAERVWKVSELIRQINADLFRYNDISVEGEATNVVRSSAGHLYFSIKDARAQGARHKATTAAPAGSEVGLIANMMNFVEQ